MKIFRDGLEIELTSEELESAYKEYAYLCEREGILSNLEYHLSRLECVVLSKNEQFIEDAIVELRRQRTEELDYEFAEENAIKTTREKYGYVFRGLSTDELCNFVKDGDNREEAYASYVDSVKWVSELLTFEQFCMELNKGYGNSGCIEIGRLLECTDGSVWYDNDYC